MPRLIHNVMVEAFIKAPKSAREVVQAVDALVPVPIGKLKEQQFRWHPEKQHTKIYEDEKQGVTVQETTTPGDAGPITVLTYQFTKQRHLRIFIKQLHEMSGRSVLVQGLERHIDEEGRLQLRLDIGALAHGKLQLVREGPCILARVNLAAYPKRHDVCREIAATLLEA